MQKRDMPTDCGLYSVTNPGLDCFVLMVGNVSSEVEVIQLTKGYFMPTSAVREIYCTLATIQDEAAG